MAGSVVGGMQDPKPLIFNSNIQAPFLQYNKYENVPHGGFGFVLGFVACIW
jgi:hypothetical protein